jgi:methylmalonyl-CoA mutase
MGGMTKAVASGMPKLRIEESAARRQAMIDRGDEVIVGVNKYKLAKQDPIDILDIDNMAVREAQIARLKATRAARDEARVSRPGRTDPPRRTGRQPAASRRRSRPRPGLGRRDQDAMEKIFGRHRAEVKTLAGVYGAAYEGDAGFEADPEGCRGLCRGTKAAARGCWWSRWARTATTAAPR